MNRIPRLLEQAEMLIPPALWDRPRHRRRGGGKVILLHGLWRGFHAMEPLARRLDQAGFSTFNIPYPSSRKPIDQLVPLLEERVAEIAEDGPVHFVTHSLGGILARLLIARDHSWQTGRLVMVAPPSNGSEIVDWASDKRLLARFLGPAGRSLGTRGVPATLPPLPDGLEAAVIMGRRCRIPFFKKLLGPENDGIVSASRGHIAGLAGFSVIDADHTFIQSHPHAVRQILRFLESGRLS